MKILVYYLVYYFQITFIKVSNFYYWSLVFCLSAYFYFPSCSSHKERLSIPVWWGVRLGRTYASIEKLTAEYTEIYKQRKGLPAIELLVQADTTTQLPKINRLSLVYFSHLQKKLQEKQIPYTLILSHDAAHPLFSHSIQMQNWFYEYEQELKQLCQERLKEYPPENFIIGTHFWKIEKEERHWENLINSIKLYYKGNLGYATVPETVGTIRFWGKLDLIGIHHPGGIKGEEKKFARKWHPIVSQIALRHQKPVFITQANLIGENKLQQLQNRIRFWDKEVRIKGIVINNIFAQTALNDTLSQYFGIANDQQLQNYLLELNAVKEGK
ncbi:MAG: hypothetical protein RML72_08065 [Bacteroidia bacterium]|nr:hypothetical protein [Bacteroidia bacterium]MDW8158814.1 hypothetical protein [Bacteroidia bacterium]